VLPGALVLLALSAIYALYGETGLVAGIFYGIKAAVLAIVVEALLRIARRILKARLLFAVAAAAFILIFFLAVPFPAIVLGAGLLGYIGGRRYPEIFAAGHEAPADAGPGGTNPSWRRALTLLVVFALAWFGPLAAIALWTGGESVFLAEGLFFSKMAVVTFGGAYAVLAYVAQQAVENYGWLQPGEMLDGLGLAETTPGPLILVLQFVGFLAAFRHATGFDPLIAGLLGAAITLWVTFVPCFLWIFLGAPYIERIGHNRALGAALSAITAAVVGVVLNLAVWFALHVVFSSVAETAIGPLRLFVPDLASLDTAALALVAIALVAAFRLHLGLLPLLAMMAGLGLGLHLLGIAG
jgi:chromate transporter